MSIAPIFIEIGPVFWADGHDKCLCAQLLRSDISVVSLTMNTFIQKPRTVSLLGSKSKRFLNLTIQLNIRAG
jgi:hypothetical protein